VENSPCKTSEQKGYNVKGNVSCRVFQDRGDVSSSKTEKGLLEEVNTKRQLKVTLELESTDTLYENIHSTIL
jgi:hypothetical protein